jgi:hypothetical protein
VTDYRAFIEAKVAQAKVVGFEVDPREMNPALKDHTRAMVRWALAGGRRALFAAFGMHKTAAQLEIMRLIGKRQAGNRLIVLPLGVRQEFFRDAAQRFTGEFATAAQVHPPRRRGRGRPTPSTSRTTRACARASSTSRR